MATAAIAPEREDYLNKEYGIGSWLFTTDHKRIALLYLISITFFFFIGGFFALLIRLELLTPASDLVQADTYNKLFTMHGQVMVFFFLIPSIPAVPVTPAISAPAVGEADAEDLAAILDTTAEGIVMFDAAGNIHAANRSAEALRLA